MKKILATLILLGFIGFSGLCVYVVYTHELWAGVIVVLVVGGFALFIGGYLLYCLWEVIYDSLN